MMPRLEWISLLLIAWLTVPISKSFTAYGQNPGQEAWPSFQRGIGLLESGAPRSDVASQWRDTLKLFPESEYTKQLQEYVAQLDIQIVDDAELAKATVENPEKLPILEQVAHYTARFSDVRGAQFSQPGHCLTFGMGEGTKVSDAVIAIGFPAIPALIERLEDRRLTRSIGFWRDFSPHRTVLRVQDVAIQAIEQIVSEQFYEVGTSSSYFSTEEPALRAEIIATVKSWWKANGNKSPLEMYLSRLNEGRAYERIDRLRKILKLDPNALDEVATLKRWAGKSYSEEMCVYAEQLARLEDFSLLPQIRERALDPAKLPDTSAIHYVTRYGNVSDFRTLRETMLSERRKGHEFGNSPFGSIAGGCCESRNPLAAPLLVDLLNERKDDYSVADRSFEALQKLTNHDAGYDRETSREERNAAIDRWLAWWKTEGQEAFFTKHPAARDVIAIRKLEFNNAEIAKLPPLVSVSDANEQLPVTFDVPRAMLSAMVTSGKVIAQENGRGQPTFRFTAANAGIEWFDSVEPVAADDPAAPKLVPAMRVKTRGLTRPDSRGRVWCTWDRALSPIAVFDGQSWQAFVEQLPPGRVDNPVGFIAAFQGTDGAMVFLDRNHRFHLFDGAGHIRADSSSDLFAKHAARLPAALQQPCPSSDAFYFHLVKDSKGRVWWSNWEADWGVVDGLITVRAENAISEVEVKRGYRHELLFPTEQGRMLVFQDGNPGRGVLVDLLDGKISRISDLPVSVDRKQTSAMAVRDRQGRVWITTRGGSAALDADGKVVAEHRGWILLEDRSGGLWFRVGDYTEKGSLVRLADNGEESVISLARIRPFWPLAESPDGTFWAACSKELVHIRSHNGQLVELARFTAPASNYMWCDNDGRLWLTSTGLDEQAVRLAVTRRLVQN